MGSSDVNLIIKAKIWFSFHLTMDFGSSVNGKYTVGVSNSSQKVTIKQTKQKICFKMRNSTSKYSYSTYG